MTKFLIFEGNSEYAGFLFDVGAFGYVQAPDRDAFGG